MKLEYIEIENFGIFDKKNKIEIRESFSTIIGENGTGKSTVLEALNLLLDKKNRKKGVSPKNIFDEDKDAFIKYVFDISEFKNIEVFLPIEEDSKITVEVSLKYDEDENMFLPTIFVGEIEKLEYTHYQTLPFDKFISVVYIKHQKDNSPNEWIENEYKETNVLKDVNLEIDKANESIAAIEQIDQFSKKVNSEVKKVFKEEGFDLKITSNVSTRKIESAINFTAINDGKIIHSHGSGFEKIFHIVSNINKLKSKNQLVIVLVDELENNLFYSYQKHIVEYLKELGVAQIIATTHAPNVVRIAPNSSITKLSSTRSPKFFRMNESTNFDFYQKDLSTAVFYDYILIVEGHSEKLFYEYLLKKNPLFSKSEKMAKVFILNNQGIGFEGVFKLLINLTKKVFVLTDNDCWSGTLHGLKRISKLLKVVNETETITLTDFSEENMNDNIPAIDKLIKKCKKYNIYTQSRIGDSFEESLTNEGLISGDIKETLKKHKLKNLSEHIEKITELISEEHVNKSEYLFAWAKDIFDE